MPPVSLKDRQTCLILILIKILIPPVLYHRQDDEDALALMQEIQELMKEEKPSPKKVWLSLDIVL